MPSELVMRHRLTSEPQPDIALVKPRSDFYAAAHPGPADTLLIVEVAESSLAYDLGVKVPWRRKLLSFDGVQYTSA
jgi:hypothetical protein